MLIQPADAPTCWLINLDPQGRTVTRDTADKTAHDIDCLIHGPATDVYLYLWNRPTARPVTVEGDERAVRIWQELACVAWR